MEKNVENMHEKLVQDPFLILVNSPNMPMCARNSFENKTLKKDYQKRLEIAWFFLSNLVPFYELGCQKQKYIFKKHM